MEPELLEELEVEDWSSTNVPQEENDSSLLTGVLHSAVKQRSTVVFEPLWIGTTW